MRFFRLRPTIALLAAFAMSPWSFAQTNITFRFSDAEAPQMRQALDDFEKLNSGIKVTLQRVGWSDARTQYLREAAVGTAPDVVEIVPVWVRPFGAAKALRPLDDLIPKGDLGLKGWSDFIGRDLALGPDGKTYAIPFATDTFALLYNKDMLAAAGYNAPPKTWPEMLEMSRKIKEKTGKLGFGIPTASCGTPAIWFFLNFYWWSHGQNLVEQGPDGKYRIGMTAAQVADSYNYFNTYVKEGLNPQSLSTTCSFAGPEVVEGLVNGDYAMASTSDWGAARVFATWKQRNPGKASPFATAVQPAASKPSTTHFGGRMIGISPNSKNVEAAWKLVQFLTKPNPTFDKYLTGYTPSQLEAVRTKKLDPAMEGFREQLLTARSWGPYATGPLDIPVMWNASGRAMGSVFIKEKTPEQAAGEFIEQMKAEMAKNQK